MRAQRASRSLSAAAASPVLVWLALSAPGCGPSGTRTASYLSTGGSAPAGTGGAGRAAGGGPSGGGGLAPGTGGVVVTGGSAAATGGASGTGGAASGGGPGSIDPRPDGPLATGGAAPGVDMRPADPADTAAADVAARADMAAPAPDAAAACVTATAGVFVNTPMPSQTGTFTARFEASPSAAPTNAVMALTNGPQTTYPGLAVATRFGTSGMIEALNGATYGATSAVSYSAGAKYGFRMVVNVSAHTYSVYVTAPGGSEQTLGTNLAFRPGQETVTSLNSWGLVTQAAAMGSTTACGFAVQ
jgi:hypothetical protein